MTIIDFAELAAGANVTFLDPGRGPVQGVAIPTPSGGGSVTQISTSRWVDQFTTSTAQDGSIANPFATVAAAIAALKVAFGVFGTDQVYCLNVFPGDYSGEAAIAWDVLGSLSIQGYAGVQPRPDFTAAVVLPDVVSTGQDLSTADVRTGNLSSTRDLLVSNNLPGTLTATRNLKVSGCNCFGAISYGLRGLLIDCKLNANLTQTGGVSETTLIGVQVVAGLTLTGNAASPLNIDAYTNYWVKTNASVIAGWTKIINGDVTP